MENYGESSFHLVFCPKYRHKVSEDHDIKTFCEEAFEKVEERHGFDMRALRVIRDNVH